MNSNNKANNKNKMAIFALTLVGLAHISHACTSISTHGKYQIQLRMRMRMRMCNTNVNTDIVSY